MTHPKPGILSQSNFISDEELYNGPRWLQMETNLGLGERAKAFLWLTSWRNRREDKQRETRLPTPNPQLQLTD